MKSIISKGKTVDEAIFVGLMELGLSIDEVTIEIIDSGSKGLFNIGKSAQVSLTERDAQEIEQMQTAARTVEREQKERSKSPNNFDRRDRRSNHRYQSDTNGHETHEQRLARLGYEYISTPATEFLSGILTRMDLDCKFAVKSEEKGTRIDIVGQNLGILIGRRGETLDSLQYLTSLVVNKGRDEYDRITIDAEDYRHKREITLIKLAKRLSSTVKKTGEKIVLEPMNPYERRILHSTLQTDNNISTYSEGEEPHRHVIIDVKREQGVGSRE